MHCAKNGLKLDFIRANAKACGTIIEDGGYIYNECGHWYKSLVFWGEISILTDTDEKRKGMEIILNHWKQIMNLSRRNWIVILNYIRIWLFLNM